MSSNFIAYFKYILLGISPMVAVPEMYTAKNIQVDVKRLLNSFNIAPAKWHLPPFCLKQISTQFNSHILDILFHLLHWQQLTALYWFTKDLSRAARILDNKILMICEISYFIWNSWRCFCIAGYFSCQKSWYILKKMLIRYTLGMEKVFQGNSLTRFLISNESGND